MFGCVDIVYTFVHMTDKKRKTIKVERTVADKARAYCTQNHIIYEKWCTEALTEKLSKNGRV